MNPGTQPIRQTRDTMILSSRTRSERRATVRVIPPVAHTAVFHFGVRDHVATLHDVTPQGAGLSIGALAEHPGLEPGDVLELTFGTSGGAVLRKGRVAWSKAFGKIFRFGVAFVELPADADCIGLINLDKVKVDPAWALRIPAGLAVRRQILPFASFEGHVYVACASPPDTATLQAVERAVSFPLRLEMAEPDSLKRAVERVYGDPQSGAGGGTQRTRSVDLKTAAELDPEDVVGLCDELLHSGILRQASDVHIDPERDGVRIRYRVDGVLEEHRRLPNTLHNGIVSRYKVLSGLDIAEKRAPQDGGFKHTFGRGGQTIDIRTATLPTKYGERMTLRLLALQTEALTLEKLGMNEPDLKSFESAIDKPHGMILLTGPTGSGKTTTLYAAIRKLIGRENLNVVTVEDPIEYEIGGVAQVEVDAADKVTFGKALRSVLRHDPDVVMIGEIRDLETADVAIKASLTGHLVFSTLHTNSAVSVITRLAHMGVERYLIAATLRLAVAQRLVRRLCPRCRKPRPMTEPEAIALGRPSSAGQTVYDPAGCIYCANRGYGGRLALFEMLTLSEDWAQRIGAGAEEAELLERMREARIATLVDDAAEKLFAGMTSVREVLGAVAVW
jgi:general secretion pathway protein E